MEYTVHLNHFLVHMYLVKLGQSHNYDAVASGIA